MKITTESFGYSKRSFQLADLKRVRGFTLIELLIVLIIVAIGVALAVPTFRAVVEKRQLTRSAEAIATFMNLSQSEAVKRNEDISVNIRRTDHDTWCIGAIAGATACDCSETTTTDPLFCDIDDVPYRITQADVISNPTYELMHRMEVNGTATSNSSFTFDPIRGTLLNLETVNIQVHTNEGSGTSREYQLEVDVLPTGRVSICTATGRKFLLRRFPTCTS